MKKSTDESLRDIAARLLERAAGPPFQRDVRHGVPGGWIEISSGETSPEPVRWTEGPGGSPLLTNKTDQELQCEISRESALSSIKEALKDDAITWDEYEVLDERCVQNESSGRGALRKMRRRADVVQ